MTHRLIFLFPLASCIGGGRLFEVSFTDTGFSIGQEPGCEDVLVTTWVDGREDVPPGVPLEVHVDGAVSGLHGALFDARTGDELRTTISAHQVADVWIVTMVPEQMDLRGADYEYSLSWDEGWSDQGERWCRTEHHGRWTTVSVTDEVPADGSAAWWFPGLDELSSSGGMLTRAMSALGTDNGRALAMQLDVTSDTLELQMGSVFRQPGLARVPCDHLESVPLLRESWGYVGSVDRINLHDEAHPLWFRDVEVGVVWDEHGDPSSGVRLHGLLDVRSLSIQESEALCALGEVYHHPCEPCPDEGDVVACVPVLVQALRAERLDDRLSDVADTSTCP